MSSSAVFLSSLCESRQLASPLWACNSFLVKPRDVFHPRLCSLHCGKVLCPPRPLNLRLQLPPPQGPSSPLGFTAETLSPWVEGPPHTTGQVLVPWCHRRGPSVTFVEGISGRHTGMRLALGPWDV